MSDLVLVTMAAALGSAARHGVDLVSRRWFPHGPSRGILAVNVIGSFVLGLLAGVVAGGTLGTRWALVVGTGFCGSLTTFSTLAAELAGLADTGRRRLLLGWTATTLLAGGVAAAAGVALGRLW